MLINAAVLRSFGEPPAYEPFDNPTPTTPDEVLIDVLAAALHPRTRSSADGSHYTSTGQLPMIPGVDGIGRGPDGRLRYFILDETHLGSMAERVVIDPPGSAPPVSRSSAAAKDRSAPRTSSPTSRRARRRDLNRDLHRRLGLNATQPGRDDVQCTRSVRSAHRLCHLTNRGIRAPTVSCWMAVTWRGVSEPDRLFGMPRALGVSWSAVALSS
jgi:hypothetical protein